MPSHNYERVAAHDEEEGMVQLPAYKSDAAPNEKSSLLVDVTTMPKDDVINMLVARVDALEQQVIKKDDLALRRKKRFHKAMLRLVVAGGMIWLMSRVVLAVAIGIKARKAAGAGQ